MSWRDTITQGPPVKRQGAEAGAPSWRNTIATPSDKPKKGLLEETFDTVDSYTGVPGRQAISKLIDTKSPLEAAKAFGKNFGTDPSEAISSRDLREKMGIPDISVRETLEMPEQAAKEVYARGADLFSPELGSKIRQIPPTGLLSTSAKLLPELAQNLSVTDFGVGMGTDYSNIIPVGLIGKGFGNVVKGGSKAIAGSKAAAKAADVADTAVDWLRPGAAKNADEIAKAAQEVVGEGKSFPEFLLTDDKSTQRLADYLRKSPTPGGAIVRSSMQPVEEGLKKYGEEVVARAATPHQTAFETGTAVSKGIGSRIDEMVEPAKKVYEGLEGQFKDTPLNYVAMKRGFNSLRKKYATDFTGSSQKLIDQLEDTAMNIKNVEELRNFRTNLGKYLQGNVSDAERDIVNEMYGIMTRERNRSIIGSAMKGSGKIGRQARAEGLLGQLKGADKTYRESFGKISDALGVEGSAKHGMRSKVRDLLEGTPPEQLTKKLFDRGDVRKLTALKEHFPEQFELLRANSLSELIAKSSPTGELSLQRFKTNLNNLQPEVREMLLGDLSTRQKSVETVLNALPPNFNPSDTATRIEFESIFSPVKSALSLGQAGLLKARTAGLRPDGLIKKVGSKAEGLLKGTKEFIKDEEGAFRPDELLKFLKPGTENVYDVKKARELVGEPKRGLLDRVEGPADVVDLGSKATSEHDRFIDFAEELGVNPMWASGVYHESPSLKEAMKRLYNKAEHHKSVFEKADASDALKQAEPPIKEEPRGLLTSLDIEPQKGLLRDKPGEVKGFTISPDSDWPARGIPELKPGTEITLPDGSKGVVTDRYSHRDHVKGRVYDIASHDDYFNNPAWDGKTKTISERELFGDKYKDVFAKEDANRAAQEKMMSDIRKKTDAQIKAVPPASRLDIKPDAARRLRDDFLAHMNEKYGDRWLDFSDEELERATNLWRSDPKTLERLNAASVTNLSVEGGPSSPRDPRFKKGRGLIEKDMPVVDKFVREEGPFTRKFEPGVSKTSTGLIRTEKKKPSKPGPKKGK